MSFDEENDDIGATEQGKKKGKTFFGLEVSDGVVYAIVAILTLVFIRQVVVVIQALT